MAITFKAFTDVVDHVAEAGFPVMLRSRHGVGKSSVVYAYAIHKGLPVVERRASQMTEGDLLGLPKLSEGCTEWIPPAWLKKACTEPVLLFIDEIDRATVEVRQGFFELTDSRKIAGWHLHERTMVFAAINGGESGAQYQVGEMDPAELDRWTVFDLEPSVEDWTTWAKDNCHNVIVDFIRHNPKHLEHHDDFEPNKVYPSRRSWHRLSEVLRRDEGLIVPGEINPRLFNLTNAFVGFEAAISLQDFVKSYKKNVTAKDIIQDGNIKLTKDFDINEHAALVDKIADADYFSKKMTKKQIDNLCKYFLSLPSEIAMKLFVAFTSNKNMEIAIANTIAFNENKEVQVKLLEICARTEEEKNK